MCYKSRFDNWLKKYLFQQQLIFKQLIKNVLFVFMVVNVEILTRKIIITLKQELFDRNFSNTY